MNLAEAKARLTVHELWRHFAFDGEPSKSCRCPWREDSKPSFSVNEAGTLWNDFATGEGGDAIDFFTLASGLPHGEACRAFIRLAGGGSIPCEPIKARPASNGEAWKASMRKLWPLLESPVTGEDDTAARAMGALAELRHVSLAGVKLMAARGLLWFTGWKDSPAWIVTDGERLNAQARRMDGKPWPGIDAKAQTLPGSKAAWPIGIKETQPFPVLLLCEGGPDLLAAHHFIHAHGREADAAAVALLGASNTIPADALPLFAGKRVRICGHADAAGRNAAARWATQLTQAGADVDAADFAGLLMADGSPVKDLNDATRVNPDLKHELENLIPR